MEDAGIGWATEEAQKRWPGQGGWADVEEGWCRVGFRRDSPRGAEKVVFGRGQSFKAAFAMADRASLREPTPRVRATSREGLPYPIAGDLFDGEET